MKTKYLYSGTKNYRTFFYSILLVITLLFAASFINLGNVGGIYAADWTSVTSAPSTFSDGYLKITSAKELAYVQKNISSYRSKNIRLANNIDMSGYNWVPIGNSSYIYTGTFDGAGHVIMNMSVSTTSYAGLFGYVSGTVKNVVISKATVESNHYAGGIAGRQSGGTITNCDVQNSTIRSTYSSNSSIYAGGIVGYSSATITQCRGFANNVYAQQNYANRSSNVYNYAGGIVGYKSGGTLNTCANANGGTVSTYCGYPKYAYTGGIAGYTTTAINTSYNEATVKGGDGSSSEYSYTGGVAGYSSKAISNCFNKGEIFGYAKTTTWSSSTFNPYSGTKQFASGVGAFWSYTLYIVSGKYTDSGGSGGFKNSTYSSEKYQSGQKAYQGGIVGYTTNTVSKVYNLGKISGSSAVFTQYYKLNFKWKANREYHLRIYQTINFEYQCVKGNIAGYAGSTVSNAYYKSSTKVSETYNFNATQKYYGDDGGTKSGMSLSSWTKNKGTGKTDTAWYIKSLDGCVYYTYHNIDASSCSKIKLSARYHNTDEKQKETTYYEISTGISSTTYTEKGTSSSSISLSKLNGDSKWATNSNINGGYPYLKDMYW